ncbi:tetratricopeptide repeat protein [Streptomyces prasinus]
MSRGHVWNQETEDDPVPDIGRWGHRGSNWSLGGGVFLIPGDEEAFGANQMNTGPEGTGPTATTGPQATASTELREPYLLDMVDTALADVAAAPPDHPDTASVRHLLAYFLTQQRRHDEALQQFRLVDGYVDAAPWRYYDDPAAVYCLWRNRAVKGARRG